MNAGRDRGPLGVLAGILAFVGIDLFYSEGGPPAANRLAALLATLALGVAGTLLFQHIHWS
jgi:hypothetical protein